VTTHRPPGYPSPVQQRRSRQYSTPNPSRGRGVYDPWGRKSGCLAVWARGHEHGAVTRPWRVDEELAPLFLEFLNAPLGLRRKECGVCGIFGHPGDAAAINGASGPALPFAANTAAPQEAAGKSFFLRTASASPTPTSAFCLGRDGPFFAAGEGQSEPPARQLNPPVAMCAISTRRDHALLNFQPLVRRASMRRLFAIVHNGKSHHTAFCRCAKHPHSRRRHEMHSDPPPPDKRGEPALVGGVPANATVSVRRPLSSRALRKWLECSFAFSFGP